MAHGRGLLRSLWMYYGRPWQTRHMRDFYGAFIGAGDLCFDIGAHVGNRTRCFRSLGARVVAVEPQPRLASVLRLILGRDRAVTLLPVAVGARPGNLELCISSATPTVSSASPGFIAAVATVPSFSWVRWDERVEVPVTTLDRLIEQHGQPSFIKIDVEGMEAEVLEGLTQPVPALSFEFIPGFRENALRCLDHLDRLGQWRFNASMSEEQRFLFESWVDRSGIEAWLMDMPREGDSGDIYARLEQGR